MRLSWNNLLTHSSKSYRVFLGPFSSFQRSYSVLVVSLHAVALHSYDAYFLCSLCALMRRSKLSMKRRAFRKHRRHYLDDRPLSHPTPPLTASSHTPMSSCWAPSYPCADPNSSFKRCRLLQWISSHLHCYVRNIFCPKNCKWTVFFFTARSTTVIWSDPQCNHCHVISTQQNCSDNQRRGRPVTPEVQESSVGYLWAGFMLHVRTNPAAAYTYLEKRIIQLVGRCQCVYFLPVSSFHAYSIVVVHDCLDAASHSFLPIGPWYSW